MNTDQVRGKHDEVTQRIIGVFYEVYNELGYGFLESVYQEAMRIALQQAGFTVWVEVPVPVHFRGHVIGTFKADLVVNDCVLLELKTCEALAQTHQSQTLHYLRATQIEVALLMNFGPEPKFKRFTMDNGKKRLRSVSSVSFSVSPFLQEVTNEDEDWVWV